MITLKRTFPIFLILFGVFGVPQNVIQTSGQVPAIKVGDRAPEIKLEKLLQAPSGVNTSTELTGKVVVLEFWATWCLPCIPAIKHLNEVAEKFQEKPVRFIAITDEQDESLIQKFLNEQPIKGWVGLDTDNSVFSAYRPGGRPHTVLLGLDGKIAAITYARNVTPQVIEDLLNGKPISLPLKPLGETDLTELPKPRSELFEVIIQPSTGSGELYGGLLNAPGRIESDGLPLRVAIFTAYKTSNFRIVENVSLPQDFYRFRVVVPKGQEESIYPVFQQALEVTFGLKVRRELREVDVAVLKPVGGVAATAKPSTSSERMEMVSRGAVKAKKQPIKKLVNLLESTFLNQPVVDETGLKDEYDWDLPFNRASNNVLLDAIRTQLGLEVTKEKRRIEILVVESINPQRK